MYFADGVKVLSQKEKALWLEVGPGRELCSLVQRHLQDAGDIKILDLVKVPGKNIPDTAYLLNRIGYLWLWGAGLSWEQFYNSSQCSRISLPTYSFDFHSFPIGRNFSGKDAFFPVGKNLPGLRPPMQDWFYVPTWKRSILSRTCLGCKKGERSKDILNSCWLVFLDEYGLGDELLKDLEAGVQDIFLVRQGHGFSNAGNREYTINPAQDFAYEELFAHILEHGCFPDHVLHLWSLSPEASSFGDDEEECEIIPNWFQETMNRGYYSLLNIARAAGKSIGSKQMRLTVVTNNTHDITGSDLLYPWKATVMGAVRVIPAEYSNIECHCVDIDEKDWNSNRGAAPQNLKELLIKEIFALAAEPLTAYRQNRRWVQVFDPVPLEEEVEQKVPLKEGGVYIITGGLGGIGLAIAQSLSSIIGVRLVLTGRSSFPSRNQWDQWLEANGRDQTFSRRIRSLKEMEERGAEIVIVSADVTDYKQMKGVIDGLYQKFGRIDGLIHAAGLADGEIIMRRTRQTSEKVIAPKISGAFVLDRLLRGKELDFQVFCSSTASILGGIGQAGYCAANNFLDAFAQYKFLYDGVFTVSINWERWRTIGIATIAESIHQKVTGESLDGGITAAEGCITLRRILGAHLPQVAVTTRSPETLITPKQDTAGQQKIETNRQGEPTLEHIQLRQRPPIETEYEAPRKYTEQVLTSIWKHFLGFEQLGVHDDFFELGGDSLKAMMVAAKIKKELNVDVPIAEFFNRPTIERISEYIEAHNGETCLSPLEPVEKKEYYPLSSAQKRLYILQLMDKNTISYNVVKVMRFEGNPLLPKIEETFKRLIDRHDSLRTSFRVIHNVPMQVIQKTGDFKIEYYEIRPREKQANGDAINAAIDRFIRPFDLSRAPLLRVGIMKIEPGGDNPARQYLLLIDMHHIAADGASTPILVQEFASLYEGKELPPLRIRCVDYVSWMNRAEYIDTVKNQREFWLQEFSREIPELRIPGDSDAGREQEDKGSNIDFLFGPEEIAPLRETAAVEGATLYMVLLAIFNILLSKLSGSEDIIIGTAISGRRYDDLQGIVGMFANTLPLRNYPAGRKTFREFLSEIKNRTLAAFDNQDYPFEDLVEALKINREANRNPLFNVLFQLDNFDLPQLEVTGLRLAQYEFEIQASKFDLRLRGVELDRSLEFMMEYSPVLFKRTTIKRFIQYFKEVAMSVINDCNIKLKDITVSHELHESKSVYAEEDFSGFKF